MQSSVTCKHVSWLIGAQQAGLVHSRQPWPAALAAAAASGGCKGCQDGLQPGIAADQLAAAMAPEGAPTAPHVAMAAAA
eukprot:scaffold12929_cov21-Tisochrysis_lutea.AAC.6